jgi:hypothetical protein
MQSSAVDCAVDCAVRQQSRQSLFACAMEVQETFFFPRREQAIRSYFNNKSRTAWESLMGNNVRRQHLHKAIVQMSQLFFNL